MKRTTVRTNLFFLFITVCLGAACARSPDSPDSRISNAALESPVSNGSTVNTPIATSNSNATGLSVGGNLKYIGCWIGDRGGGLKFETHRVTHFDRYRGRTFKSEYFRNAGDSSSDARTLIKIEGLPKLEFLKPFVSIEFQKHDADLNKDKVLVRGYASYDDLLHDNFITSEFFYSVDCVKELGTDTAK